MVPTMLSTVSIIGDLALHTHCTHTRFEHTHTDTPTHMPHSTDSQICSHSHSCSWSCTHTHTNAHVRNARFVWFTVQLQASGRRPAVGVPPSRLHHANTRTSKWKPPPQQTESRVGRRAASINHLLCTHTQPLSPAWLKANTIIPTSERQWQAEQTYAANTGGC